MAFGTLGRLFSSTNRVVYISMLSSESECNAINEEESPGEASGGLTVHFFFVGSGVAQELRLHALPKKRVEEKQHACE